MPEAYGAAQDASVGAGTPSGNSPGASSVLACYACKRRKVKCSRELPACALCQKLDGLCEYPTHPEKPGPKTGSLQRAKRRRLEPETGNANRDVHLNAPRPTGAFDPIRDTTTSPVAGYSRDASRSRPVVAPDGGAGAASPASPSTTKSHPTAPIFSRLMYPSHEAQTRPPSPATVDTSPALRRGAISVASVCAALKISRQTYDMLMDAYFTNMTSFTLFRPGSIEPKFAVMQSHSEAEALVAGMFSFSARHCQDAALAHASHCPSPSYFWQIASTQLDESVDRYGDMRPPFWLLQAGILVTFYQLTLSVRSRSWKKLGDCIRYSYDLNLHMVDANHEPASSAAQEDVDLQRWAILEERRRAWWAIWEMDVFASTIRQLPTAIDSSLNLTLLPVSDRCWFHHVYQESCFLAEDCSLRWKHLVQSGNQSAKAWFIVINSLMRNTQRIVYPAGSAIKALNERHAEASNNELDIMANCLYCTISSLPASLSYQGEALDFRPGSSPHDAANARLDHADKYSIHLMTQLCRFMIYHHKICARAPWLTPSKRSREQTVEPGPPPSATANSEWSNYMSASDEIVLIVRNSSRDHYKYVNPFLTNTLWFAAAAQCACKVFGPASFDRRLISSNLDLLKLTIGRFISFWDGMENLKWKLARIEAGLKNLMAASADGTGNGAVADASDLSPRTEKEAAVQRAWEDRPSRSAVGPSLSSESHPSAQAVQQFAMHGQEPLLLGGVAPNAWSGELTYVPHLPDFAQPLPTGGQGFFTGDPMDVSPFGLEELLLNSMMQQM